MKVLTSILALLLMSAAATAGDVKVTVGERQTLLRSGQHGLYNFPDEPIGVFRQAPKLLFTLVANGTTYLMRGRTFKTSAPIGKVLGPSKVRGSFDRDYAGVSSVYFDKKRNQWLCFYHGESHRKGTVGYTGSPKGTCTIGLAVLSKNGRRMKRAGKIISCNTPPDPKSDRHLLGVGDVSVISDHTNTYLYAYYTCHSRTEGRSTIICMARSKISDGGRPGTWRKYRKGSFSTKGLGGKDSQVANLYGPHVTYVKSMKKYIMVGNRGGIHFCQSDDGIHWSKIKILVQDGYPVPFPGKPTAMRPHLYLYHSNKTSARGYLMYCYSPKWGGSPEKGIPFYFVRRPLTLSF